MIRRLAALALAFACSPPTSSAQGAEDSADQVLESPLEPELDQVDEVFEEKDDDLEDVEDLTHRLLDQIADQVQAARPDLAEEVLAELCRVRDDDQVLEECDQEPAELEIEPPTSTPTSTPDTGKE